MRSFDHSSRNVSVKQICAALHATYDANAAVAGVRALWAGPSRQKRGRGLQSRYFSLPGPLSL